MKSIDRAKKLVGKGWFTTQDLAEQEGCSNKNANSRINVMNKNKCIHIERKRSETGVAKYRVLAITTPDEGVNFTDPNVALWRLAIFGQPMKDCAQGAV